MALILTDYDLSSGATSGDSDVTTPNNWRVTATITGAPAKQAVRIDLYVQDSEGNWAVMTDNNDQAIHLTLFGNETKSVNPIVVNAAAGRIRVYPPKNNAVGTLNVDSINS